MNFLNKIFDYIKSVANPTNGNAEAKLFIALTGFFFLMLGACVDLFTGGRLTPSDFVYYTIAGLVTACLGLGTIGEMKAMGVKGDVANTVVKESGGQETTQETTLSAKEILASDKP